MGFGVKEAAAGARWLCHCTVSRFQRRGRGREPKLFFTGQSVPIYLSTSRTHPYNNVGEAASQGNVLIGSQLEFRVLLKHFDMCIGRTGDWTADFAVHSRCKDDEMVLSVCSVDAQLLLCSDCAPWEVLLWVNKRLCDYYGGLFQKWEQMTKEQLGLACHLTVSYGLFPSLAFPCLRSHFPDSHAALAWYRRPRRTNEDVSLLLKTTVVTKMTVFFFPSSHLLTPIPPPQQMGWGESQPAFFESISTSALVVCVWTYEMATFFYSTGSFKSCPRLCRSTFFYFGLLCAFCCMERWGWEDKVKDSNETWAKVWPGLVSLPFVISYFQTAHHRERKTNREEELLGED